jgi:hypothetical protein
MATKRRRYWPLRTFLALVLLCLIFRSVRVLEALDTFQNDVQLASDVTNETVVYRISDAFRRTDASSNEDHTVERMRPWRVREIVPLVDKEQEYCDSSLPSPLPTWMEQLSFPQLTSKQSSTYQTILQEFPPFHANSLLDLPIPLQLLQEYQLHHSEESLRHSPGCRKFLVAHYRCPESAGNRLHEFTNSYLWAVLLNRTLLWKYMDDRLCTKLQHKFHFVNDEEQCTLNNTAHDCAKVLERAPWIPSYDEWQGLLGLPEIEFVSVGDFGLNRSITTSLGMDEAYEHILVLGLQPMSRRFDIFGLQPHSRAEKLSRLTTLERAEQLFSMGHRLVCWSDQRLIYTRKYVNGVLILDSLIKRRFEWSFTLAMSRPATLAAVSSLKKPAFVASARIFDY